MLNASSISAVFPFPETFDYGDAKQNIGSSLFPVGRGGLTGGG
jgi:hypothetical protein